MTSERRHCPACDILCYVDESGNLRPVGYKTIGSRPCRRCGAPLCVDKHHAWSEPQTAPQCDLWFGHPGLHRKQILIPIEENLAWGSGDPSWERADEPQNRTDRLRGALQELHDAVTAEGIRIRPDGPEGREGPHVRLLNAIMRAKTALNQD